MIPSCVSISARLYLSSGEVTSPNHSHDSPFQRLNTSLPDGP
ncbi:hypothetical protein FOFC_11794 [Fusarium oxysporum]|nr:hypothetical protein FOFC_11794 [Fusarium oxysporum]